ncbi:MAG: sigma-70 family RNA polymerase sigma factor [Eubacterium sp.]|nr:sigma-70 family RNA polymerase sigma factor [Eubacterium sp.]
MDKARLTQAVVRYQAGDQAAFNDIYELTNANLFIYAKSLMKDPTRAEDLLQNAYIDILGSISKLNDPGAFLTWSKRILFYKSAHYYRDNSNEFTASTDDDFFLFDQMTEEDSAYIPEENLDLTESSEIVWALIDELPELQRTAMLAFYRDEMTLEEIAYMTGTSVGTVKTRLFYGRKAFKEKVENYEKKHDIRLHGLAVGPVISMALKAVTPASFILGRARAMALLVNIARIAGTKLAAASAAGAVSHTAAGAATNAAGAAANGVTGTALHGTAGATPFHSGTTLINTTGTITNTTANSSAFQSGSTGVNTTTAGTGSGATGFTPGSSAANNAAMTTIGTPQQTARTGHSATGAQSGHAAIGAYAAHSAISLKLIAIIAAVAVTAGIAVTAAVHFMGPSESPVSPGNDTSISTAQSEPDSSAQAPGENTESSTSGISTEVVSDYSRAYLSVLRLYEQDIRDYTWQNGYENSGVTDSSGGTGLGTPVSRAAALKDIDGDGIPELFFMTSVYTDRHLCADLHIFTYRDGGLRELSYDFTYPSELTVTYYDEFFGHFSIDHNGRLIHYDNMDPNSSYAVFTGKTPGTLYMLCTHWLAEEFGVRIRKFTMDSGTGTTSLDISSDAYLFDWYADGRESSEGMTQDLESALSDMGDIVIYGGNEIGAPSDAEKSGWQNMLGGRDNGNVDDIAPERFQNSLNMTYDEIVALLMGQITGDPAVDTGSDTSADPEAYVPLTTDEELCQAGAALFRYDSDSNMIKYTGIGDTDVKSFDMSNAYGTGYTYTDGKSVLYFSYDEGAGKYPLIRYDLASGKAKMLHEFDDDRDINSSYYIGTVYNGKAYVGLSKDTTGNKLWMCGTESGETTELETRGLIKHRIGKYVLMNEGRNLSVQYFTRTDIYELTDAGMKHVADLGQYVSVVDAVVDGKFYYTVGSSSDSYDASICRCNADGSGTEVLGQFLNNDSNFVVDGFTPEYCIIRKNDGTYRYTYSTDLTVKIE